MRFFSAFSGRRVFGAVPLAAMALAAFMLPPAARAASPAPGSGVPGEADRGVVVFPQNLFPEGGGRPIPVYVPPATGVFLEAPWPMVRETTCIWGGFSFWRFVSAIRPSGVAASPVEAAVRGMYEALRAGTESLSAYEVKIIVQKSQYGGALRAVVQLKDRSLAQFVSENAGRGDSFIYSRCGDVASRALMLNLLSDMAGGFGLPKNRSYDLHFTVDSAHREDSYTGYLSVSPDGCLVMTPKLYPQDRLVLLHQEFLFRPVVDKDMTPLLAQPVVLSDEDQSAVAQALAPIQLAFTPPLFNDLAGYEWARDAVESLASQGILKGVGGQRFDPAASVSRAQYAALLERLFRLPPPARPLAFSDLRPTDWEFGAVQAVSPYAGVADGQAFRPDDPVDRETAAALLVRILNGRHGLAVLGGSQVQAVLAGVRDAGRLAPSLRALVATAVNRGIMVGMPDGSFAPQGSVTRAQAAVLLRRVQTDFMNQ